jgi:LytS/YehU family sensor histidine kinase
MFEFNPIFSDMPPMTHSPRPGNWPKLGLPWLPAASRFLMVLGLGTLVEFYTKFELEQQRIEELEKQKIMKELTFLKSQLNPHFLFNSLNNIYSLAIKKSNEAPQAVLLLSEMLRYVIYESGKSIVSLSQEVHFIKNYITLEKMKFSSENMPKITCNFSILPQEFPIEPLLFITLVENAFKHGISMVSPSFILISFKEDQGEIHMSVINSTVKSTLRGSIPITKGIGLDNLHKRLSLLYPGRHTFNLVQEKSLFKAFLTIKKK